MANKCFHGLIKDWKSVLTNDGDYLIRQDPKFGNQYILTVKIGEKYLNILMLNQEGEVVMGEKRFRSIEEFLHIHSSNGAKLKLRDQSFVELRRPVTLEL